MIMEALPMGMSLELDDFSLREFGAVLLPSKSVVISQSKLQFLLNNLKESQQKYVDPLMQEFIPDDVFMDKTCRNENESYDFVKEVLKFMELEGEYASHIRSHLRLMWEQFDFSKLNCRFEIISGNSCEKFHVDHVGARLIMNLTGPGTEMASKDDEKDIYRVESGSSILLKGTKFKGFQEVLLHRSPSIKDSKDLRLLFIADF